MIGGTDHLVMPRTAGVPLTVEVAHYGAQGLETGGFLAAPETDPMRVRVVVVAGERGITRGRGLFRVSGKAIETLFGWADAHALRIPAQFHSHGVEAFLSETDRRDGFNVTDFISAVVPHFRQPPTDPGSWGWWIFDGGGWVPTPPPGLVEDPFHVVIFDEDGVRGHD